MPRGPIVKNWEAGIHLKGPSWSCLTPHHLHRLRIISKNPLHLHQTHTARCSDPYIRDNKSSSRTYIDCLFTWRWTNFSRHQKPRFSRSYGQESSPLLIGGEPSEAEDEDNYVAGISGAHRAWDPGPTQDWDLIFFIRILLLFSFVSLCFLSLVFVFILL